MAKFDPYHKWLGIPPRDQPPNHYRLLGIDTFEGDLDVIEAAADRCMAFVQQCALGEHQKESQQILNELSAARVCLLVAEEKEKYDTEIRAKLKPSASEASPTGHSNQQQVSKSEPLKLKVLIPKAAWTIAGGACLLLLMIIIISIQFMGGDEEPASQDQTAAIAQQAVPLVPDSNQLKTAQKNKPASQSNHKSSIPKPQSIVPVEPAKPKAPMSPPITEYTIQFSVNAEVSNKQLGDPLKSVTIELFRHPKDKGDQQVSLGTITTDATGQAGLLVKLTPKQQAETFLAKLSRGSLAWDRELTNFPQELSQQFTIPVFSEHEYLNPVWIEQRLTQVGIDKLLEEYKGNKDPDIQTIRATLDLSQHILRDNPQAVREQMQARLVHRKEPAFAAFQILPNNKIQIRSEWPSFNQPGGPLVRTLDGHSNSVRCVVVTPDGTRAVSGFNDKTLKVWDLANGKLIRTLTGHSTYVHCVAVTPDGKQVISGSEDKTLKVWNLETGKLIQTLEGHSNPVECVAITPDGKQAVSGSVDKTLNVWDLANGKLIRMLEGHSSGVSSLAVTPDGGQAISGSYDKTLKVWDLNSGRLIQTLKGHSNFVYCVAVTPDGKQIISGSGDKTLKVWNLETGKLIQTLEGHLSSVYCVAVTPDGKQVISGSYDRTAKIWDLNSGKLIRTLEGHSTRVTCVAVTPDGKQVISGSGDKTLKVWDIESDMQSPDFARHFSFVGATAVTPNGKQAILGSVDNTLKVRELSSGRLIRTLKGHSEPSICVFLTPDGKQAVSGSVDKTLNVWDLASGKLIRTLEGHSSFVRCVAVTPDGKQVISGSGDKTIKVWDLNSGKLIQTLKGHSSSVQCVAVTPDGKQVISGSNDKTLKVWNLETGKLIWTLEGHLSSVYCVAVTPDGKQVISGSSYKTLKAWNLETGKLIRTFEGHSSDVASLAVTPAGNQVVSVSSSGMLKVWNLPSYKLIKTYTLDDRIAYISLSRDGKTLVVGGAGNPHILTMLLPGETTTSYSRPAPVSSPKKSVPAANHPALLVAPFSKQAVKAKQAAWAEYLKTAVVKTNSIGMKLVLVPPGEFMMGSPASEKGRLKEELQHKVRITQPYFMGTTEVTQGQWKQVMGTKPWKGERVVKEGTACPAVPMSWDDAQEFIKKLSKKEGAAYRLPTEAEWEYACRAGSTTAYGFGDDTRQLKYHAWYDRNADDIGKKYAHRVGQKKSNMFGLYDMHGNVWEWCQDWYGDYPSGAVTDPRGLKTGSYRVSRGGGWNSSSRYCRSAYRNGSALRGPRDRHGFRVVSYHE